MFRYPYIPRKEKKIEIHPYHNLIKEKFIPRLRFYHNSVRNPDHPEKKDQKPDVNRTTFTVFGDMKSKEFIYCVNIVQGLHKYRWKLFETPVIKGVTAIEWPQLLHTLKLTYGPEVYSLDSPAVVLVNGKLLGGQRHLKAIMDSNYHYFMNLDYPTLSKQRFIDHIKETGHTYVFMHIDIENELAGTLIFELFDDKLPKTCNNFIRLCKATKGGYSGTPVHRIVTDGWIQCGGFGLKSVPMDCENFIVKHDRRGLLCMANAEKHIDCSTQFFVLLQPAPWMDKKYVAFGQLIDGEETLKKIETVPTWYESPLLKIIISKAGLVSLDSEDIEIYKGTKEYLDGHIENLSDLEDYLLELLMRRLWLAIEYKEVVSKYHGGHGEEEVHPEEPADQEEGDDRALSKLRTTKRFLHKGRAQSPGKGKISADQEVYALPEDGSDNKDFDVEEYQSDEGEQSPYTLQSILGDAAPEKPFRPYYIALTDVPYLDEKTSTYDLRKFLDGEYCLQSDVVTTSHKVMVPEKISYVSEVMTLSSEELDNSSDDKSIDLSEEKEMQDYLKGNIDRYCFAGGVIKKIAKGIAMTNFFDGTGDDGRSAKSEGSPKGTPGSPKSAASPSPSAMSAKSEKYRRVSVFAPPHAQWREEHPSSYRRRPTGIRLMDIEKVKSHIKTAPPSDVSFDESTKKAQEDAFRMNHIMKRAPKPPSEAPVSAALTQLFQKALYEYEGDAPTLKDYATKHLASEKTIKIQEHSREKAPSLTGDSVSMRSISRRRCSTDSRKIKTISFTDTAIAFPKNVKSMTIAQYQEMNKTRRAEAIAGAAKDK